MNDEEIQKTRGALAWMAKNRVAANLAMVMLLAGGLVIGGQIKQEVFPEFDLDVVQVSVAYPGASPAEVEQGVLLAIEEQVRGIDGVKRVTSTAVEGSGSVNVEVALGSDRDRVFTDVKNAVDRVVSFPEDAERPVVSLVNPKQEVISLVIHGEQEERVLRRLAEEAREELLRDPRISQVELGGVRPYEISVEVPRHSLRTYGLTLDAIAAAVARGSVELPGGGIKTPGGEVLVRTAERRQRGADFEKIAVLSRPDGSEVLLGELANVIDGFSDTDEEAFFDGERAALVKVFRVGAQTPIDISTAVKEYHARWAPTLPAGVNLSLWSDASEIYGERVDLLLRNGRLGLLLVLLVLAMFLESRLAFWVTMGIPISFIGSLVLMPSLDVSINMISLFAFIVTIGIVVDDAVVVGEAIYHQREQGRSYLAAAIAGVREVAGPVFFSVLTTIIAFSPMLFVPGVSGKFFRNIPLVVIAVLILSLVESLFILPAHLSHGGRRGRFAALVSRGQRKFAQALSSFINRAYLPSVRLATRLRYFTFAVAIGGSLAALGIVAGGRIDFTFLPKIDSDRVVATIQMPFGAAVSETKTVKEKVLQAAESVMAEVGREQVARGVFSQVGGQSGGFGPNLSGANRGSHIAQVTVYLRPAEQRALTASQMAKRWRQRVGEIPGVESLTFRYSTGPGSAAPIDIELSHAETATLQIAAAELAGQLNKFNGVVEVDDGFAPGKQQLDFALRPEARSLGVTEQELAKQLRAAFFGALAVRQQRGRDEVRTYVRLPKHERQSEYDLEQLLIRTPAGGEIPLTRAAMIERGRSFTEIKRIDGRRVVNVTADIKDGTNANEVMAALAAEVTPGLKSTFVGLSARPGGDQRDQAETLTALRSGFGIAMIAIFAVLAIAFRSYTQPGIIMAAIPFGFVGALGGHLLLGYDLSLISMMGVVALAGIVVNDSLVLIVAINRYREQGMSAQEAVVAGGARRFRPIMLTSLTTFFGLMPMILEPSTQARFLIPMAISLGFGVLFSTAVILVLVPALYLILDDLIVLARNLTAGVVGDSPDRPALERRPV